MPRHRGHRSGNRAPRYGRESEERDISAPSSTRSNESGHTNRSSASSRNTYDRTPDAMRFPLESDNETIREDGEVPSGDELPVHRRWDESDDSGDEGQEADQQNVEFSPQSYGSATPNGDVDRYIQEQQEEIHRLKRQLEETTKEKNRVEYEFRQERRDKLGLEYKIRRLEHDKKRNRERISHRDNQLKLLEQDNSVLVEENNCLSDISQQYFHSKEQELKARKKATRHLDRKKREYDKLKHDMNVVTKEEEMAEAWKFERTRADHYRTMMLNMSTILSTDREYQGEGPQIWRTCEICVRQYTDQRDMTPRVLIGCGHTVCHSCVVNLKSSEQEQEHGIRCPFDRLPTTFPDGSPSSLPINYSLIRM